MKRYRRLARAANQPRVGFNCCFIVLIHQLSLSFLADKYAVRFIPHENGIHSIDVKFNGSHVVGSPFRVRVGEPGQAGNPALVTAYGSGLESGTTGNPPRAPAPPCARFGSGSARGCSWVYFYTISPAKAAELTPILCRPGRKLIFAFSHAPQVL